MHLLLINLISKCLHLLLALFLTSVLSLLNRDLSLQPLTLKGGFQDYSQVAWGFRGAPIRLVAPVQAVVSAHRENAGVSHSSFLTKGHCTVLFGSGSSVSLVVANVWDRRLVPETHRSSCILVRCFGRAPIDREIL